VPETAADRQRLREVVRSSVIPRWIERCGDECVKAWNATIGPVVDIRADAEPR
jgi:hypothetical protein